MSSALTFHFCRLLCTKNAVSAPNNVSSSQNFPGVISSNLVCLEHTSPRPSGIRILHFTPWSECQRSHCSYFTKWPPVVTWSCECTQGSAVDMTMQMTNAMQNKHTTAVIRSIDHQLIDQSIRQYSFITVWSIIKTNKMPCRTALYNRSQRIIYRCYDNKMLLQDERSQ